MGKQMSLAKGTPASSQIIWLEGRVQELEQELAEAKKKYLQVCAQHGHLVDQVYEEDGETLKHIAAYKKLAAIKDTRAK